LFDGGGRTELQCPAVGPFPGQAHETIGAEDCEKLVDGTAATFEGLRKIPETLIVLSREDLPAF
jgi:hypothetical protein